MRLPLEALLRTSDVVSVHVTLTDETRHLLGEPELRLMQSHAYLINTSRGPVIDETALYHVLREGHIAGAALDVFEQEPLPLDSPLRALNHVMLTPHIAGHSQELMASIPPTAVDNILRILRHEPPVYIKNPDVLSAWRIRLDCLNGQP